MEGLRRGGRVHGGQHAGKAALALQRRAQGRRKRCFPAVLLAVKLQRRRPRGGKLHGGKHVPFRPKRQHRRKRRARLRVAAAVQERYSRPRGAATAR